MIVSVIILVSSPESAVEWLSSGLESLSSGLSSTVLVSDKERNHVSSLNHKCIFSSELGAVSISPHSNIALHYSILGVGYFPQGSIFLLVWMLNNYNHGKKYIMLILAQIWSQDFIVFRGYSPLSTMCME